MENNSSYLSNIIQKYSPRNLEEYSFAIKELKSTLQTWAWKNDYYINILDSGSRAKGTAIFLASDVDFMVSLTNNFNENGSKLESIANSLYDRLRESYDVKKQNVSIRMKLPRNRSYLSEILNYNDNPLAQLVGKTPSSNLPNQLELLAFPPLEVDITPARKKGNNTNYHSLWLYKQHTWKQTNIQQHISDVSTSGRIQEIKLLKIWRELNKLDFSSIYLEYLVIKNILYAKPFGSENLVDNFLHILLELAKNSYENPLFENIIDPANSNNILSDLLTIDEKNKIINKAKSAITSLQNNYWRHIVW